MRAFHLAAGRGSRLRPLTDNKPKPLVELDGQSLLHRNVETLASVGVDDQIVVTGYMADRIRERGYDVVHNDIYQETEMVYSLFCAADRFPKDSDMLVSYGDILYDTSIVSRLLQCTAPLCVVVDTEWQSLWEQRFEDPLADAETLDFDGDGTIREIGDEPESYADIDGQYIGLIKVKSGYVDALEDAYEEWIDTTTGSLQMTSFLQYLIDTGWSMGAVPVSGKWLEVDTLADIELYRRLLTSESEDIHVSWLQ